MAGNTTLRGFLEKIEEQYGKAERIWVMDRGIPTEEVLGEMRMSAVSYLVGTPKERLNRYEKALTDQPWHKVREGVEVSRQRGLRAGSKPRPYPQGAVHAATSTEEAMEEAA